MHELLQVPMINSLLVYAQRVFKLVHTGELLVSNTVLTIYILNSSTNIVIIILYFLFLICC